VRDPSLRHELKRNGDSRQHERQRDDATTAPLVIQPLVYCSRYCSSFITTSSGPIRIGRTTTVTAIENIVSFNGSMPRIDGVVANAIASV
jgi:hypothetical protein